MYISIDFNSDEALYLQLRNQIIMAIVKAELQEGENLPSVREMADMLLITCRWYILYCFATNNFTDLENRMASHLSILQAEGEQFFRKFPVPESV